MSLLDLIFLALFLKFGPGQSQWGFMRISWALNKLMSHSTNVERYDKSFMSKMSFMGIKVVCTISNICVSWKQLHETFT